MLFFETPRIDMTSIAPGDAPGDDDPYEKRIALARELEGVELKNPYKEAGDPGHLAELKEAFRKQTDEMAGRHPERRGEIALPEFSTPGEVFNTSLATEDLTHSFIGKGLSIERAYDDQINTIKQLTGKELPNPVSQAGDPGHYYELKEEFKRQAEELAEQHPELRSRIVPLSSIDRLAGRIRDKSERHAEEVWERSEKDAGAWIARIGGGFYSFLHDPVQMATSAAVGFKAAGVGVKGLLWMGLKQGAANAGQEAVMQPFVQQWRKEANMDYGWGRAATDIGMAGAFGFGLDVGVRSGVRGLRQAVGRPYLGPDAGATPTMGGDGSPGAQLPGLPEGRAAPEPPAPRIYRGADPLPPMEALEQAARNAPEGSVLRRASEGDEQALRELAAALGPDADPAIRRALDELELEKLFPTPLHVDDGAHLESLARAIREESGAADLPAGDAIVAPVRREVARLADEVEGIAARLEDKPVAFRSIDPATVTTDASTFQFKSGGDVSGVTDRLRGVTRWDPVSAGKAIVFERADGSMVIADGHQRLGLAKRVAASGQDAKLDAYVFREADGWTPEDVRAYAALKNMRESSGTSVDMAQVMRDRPDLIDGSLPLTDAKLRDAAMLARLSPEAFDAVVAGRLPPPFAALIGESVADSTRHRGLLDEMAAADLANTQQARLYLKQLMELPTTTETQMTLFGEESFTRTVLVERAQVLDGALRTLRADKRIFGLLRDQARAIEGAGNVLAREANQAKAESAAQLAELIEKLATSRGTVATILNDAAASVARGLDPKLASRAFVDRIADTLEREGLPGLVKVEEAPKPELAPVRMDDPIGPEAKAQAEDINWALELDDEIKFAIRAYHGTPHDFDRFDLGKIGTGEGAQVFGHGLYFAENKTVADQYREALSLGQVRIDGKTETDLEIASLAEAKLKGLLGEREIRAREWVEEAHAALNTPPAKVDKDSPLAAIMEHLPEDRQRDLQDAEEYLAKIERMKAADVTSGGSVYEVDIDAEPHQLLDYDAKLADQPEMLAKMEKLLRDAGSDVSPDILRTQPGSWAYSELEAMLGSADAASRALKDAGIPGLRYLDQGSRGPSVTYDVGAPREDFGPYSHFTSRADAEKHLETLRSHGFADAEIKERQQPQSRNIVIFDDSLIKITHKNGKAVSAEERQAAVDAMFSLRQSPDQPRTATEVKVFHGTGADFERFDADFFGQRGEDRAPGEKPTRTSEKAFFFTDDTELAGSYAEPRIGDIPHEERVAAIKKGTVPPDAEHPFERYNTQVIQEEMAKLEEKYFESGGRILPVFVETKNFKRIDMGGYEWRSDEGKRLRSEINKARKEGKSGLIIDGMRDGSGSEATQYAVWEKGTVRSALSEQQMFSLRGGKGDQTRTPEFKRWFGDSKVVDEGGKPLRVYHGTSADIEAFDPARADGGIFFSSGVDVPNKYAMRNEGANLIPAYVRIENPAPTYQAFLDDAKYDGYFSHQTYVVRTPEQIKSAIGNRGTFDPNDPRISFATPPRNATLHNTTLSTRAADEMALMRAEIDKAIAKSLPAGWRAEVRQRLVFGDLSERIQKRNPGVPPSLEIEGTFDPYEKIIYVSMAALDPVERAFEEAGHALKSMRLIPEADYGILQAKAKEIGAREKFRIDERYGDVYGARWKDNPARLEEALEEEAIMQMVAARARGDDFGRKANAILDKLLTFLRSIRDMLGLKGFRSFEDVFEDMTEGGFARQMDAQRGGAGAGRTVGGEVMAGGPGKTADAAAGASVTQTPAFRKWFGGSKVVDEGGKPLVVYHGTRSDIDENFAFREALIGSSTDAGHYGRGFYFASTSGEAGYYGPNVEGFYLSMKKPLDLTNNTGDYTFPGHFLAWYPKLKEIGMTTPEVDAIWKAHREMVEYIEKNARILPAGAAGSPTEGFMASVEHPILGRHSTRPGWQGSIRDAWARTPQDAKAELLDRLISEQRYYRDQFPVEMDYPSLSDFIRVWHPEGARGITAAAKKAGHDGIIYGDEYIAFEPTQIKSVDNGGAFNPDDPRIRFALRDPESPTATDASFIARAQAASEIMFALGDEGKGKTPAAGGEAKPAPEGKSEGQAASTPAKATAAPSLPGGRESKRIRNLINQYGAEGKLSREEAADLLQRFDTYEAFHKDANKAKQQIAKQLDADAEKRKANKELAEFVRRALVNMVTGFRDARGQSDPAKAMQTLIENLGQFELPQGFVDVAGHQRAIYGMALAQLDAMLHEFKGVDFSASGVKVALTGKTRNKARLSNVVRELHGEKTGDEAAAGFALTTAKVMEDLRLRFNAAGGNIAKRKDWAMPQSHDKVALLKGGKATWVDFTLPLLDLKWMKHPLTGDDMPPAEARKMLGDVWDNLVSDGWHEREAAMGHRGVSAIANTRADPRSLIFANADAWLKYSERFGSGDDALAILISHIRGMTKDIAAMEVLGPNPTAMLEYLKQFVLQQANLRRAGMPAHFPTVREITGIEFKPGSKWRDPVSYANAMTKRAENMWRIYTGAASAPESTGWAEVSTTIKNANVATKLGGAFVSGLGDPFWQIAARKFAGLPATKIISGMVRQIAAGGEREARRSGVIAETFLHMHNEGAREGAAWSASKISGYIADRVLSLSMLNSLTRAGNHTMSMGIQGHLADMAAKSFADLDPRLQRMFRRWGLAATDWDAIRLDANGRVREVDFLSPADIRRQLVDNGGDPSIAERYLGMTLGEAQYATLTGTITAQARVYGNMQAGTAQRELWSMFMQFKSFAVNLALLQISRMAREFVSQGFSRGAQYAALALGMATLGGALVEQLQQLRNGKDPRAMNTPEFWGAAAYRSGGMSIWGDLLYASENRFGGGVASTIAGPSAGTLNDILNLTYGSAKKTILFSESQEKTNFGRQLSSAVSRYTPGSSIWYVRAAWERALMDNLQRMLDPEADASFRRKIQNARRDYKQDFWWKPGGGFVPQRGPRMEAAFPAR